MRLLLLVGCLTLSACGSRLEGDPPDSSTGSDAGSDSALTDVNAPVDAGPRPDASGDAVPLYVGEMAFNEYMNDGFSNDIVVNWQASALRVDRAGRLTGHFVTTYGGPSVAALARRDALFLAISATYVYLPIGDTTSRPVLVPTGVLATTSTESGATFDVDLPFTVPIPPESMGMPLRDVQVELTWVRAYRRADETWFHVLPARTDSTHRVEQIPWDYPNNVTGKIGYYQPIAESRTKPETFDYPTWFRTHTTW